MSYEPPTSRRKPHVAVAAALILPMVVGAFGAGHFYAHSYPRGFVLLGLGLVSAFVGITGEGLGWLGVLLVVAIDAVGACRVIAAAQGAGIVPGPPS